MSVRTRMKGIYKITYPNGKIYIGKDLTGSINAGFYYALSLPGIALITLPTLP